MNTLRYRLAGSHRILGMTADPSLKSREGIIPTKEEKILFLQN